MGPKLGRSNDPRIDELAEQDLREMQINLQVLRINAGLTQDEVAAKLRTKGPYVAAVENGDRLLSQRRLAQLLRIYGAKLGVVEP
jgi:transcriptional regulator with XRE-family HTH domain